MDFAKIVDDITGINNAPEWRDKDNILAKAEAIRLRTYRELLDLGFDHEEIHIDVSIIAKDNTLLHLAKELGWKTRHHWYEPHISEGGDITIYYEPPEQVF